MISPDYTHRIAALRWRVTSLDDHRAMLVLHSLLGALGVMCEQDDKEGPSRERLCAALDRAVAAQEQEVPPHYTTEHA
jgi:hypothetical protein